MIGHIVRHLQSHEATRRARAAKRRQASQRTGVDAVLDALTREAIKRAVDPRRSVWIPPAGSIARSLVYHVVERR